MSDVLITYGVDLFDGVGPPPLVSVVTQNNFQSIGSHISEVVTLNGRIQRDDCGGTGFKDPYDKLKLLLSRLNVPFQNLVIEEDAPIYEWQYAIVRNVSVDDNTWYDWIPYTIEFECFREGFFASDGIINPTREVSAENAPDNTVNITIACSCKGQNNSNAAIENARSFCFTNSAFLASDLTNLYWTLEVVKDAQSFLRSEQEEINRLTGEVTVTRTFVLQEEDWGFTRGVLRFTTETSINEVGEAIVSVQGSHEGSFQNNDTLQSIEENIKNYDWYSVALAAYQNATGETNLFTSPVGFSLERNIDANTLSFSLEYSNKKFNDIYLVDETTITKDETQITCMEVSVEIRSDLKCQQARWEKILDYYNTFNFPAYVQQKWDKYGTGKQLNWTDQNNSYSENQFEGVIQVSSKFCESQGQDCGCLRDMDYQYDFTPALKEYKISIPVNGMGCHYIEDLMLYKRAIFAIRGRVLKNACCSIEKTIAELRGRINQISNSLFPGKNKTLDQSNITKNVPAGEVSFDFAWSAEEEPIIPENLL